MELIYLFSSYVFPLKIASETSPAVRKGFKTGEMMYRVYFI